jgi:hypothetical protein
MRVTLTVAKIYDEIVNPSPKKVMEMAGYKVTRITQYGVAGDTIPSNRFFSLKWTDEVSFTLAQLKEIGFE